MFYVQNGKTKIWIFYVKLLKISSTVCLRKKKYGVADYQYLKNW